VASVAGFRLSPKLNAPAMPQEILNSVDELRERSGKAGSRARGSPLWPNCTIAARIRKAMIPNLTKNVSQIF